MPDFFDGGTTAPETRNTAPRVLTVGNSGFQNFQKWIEVRESVEEEMKRDGTWSAVSDVLLDEYIGAMRLAEEARLAINAEPFHVSPKTGRSFAHPGWIRWDGAARRAIRMADLLGITPRARQRLGISLRPAEDEVDEFGPLPPLDPFDELASRARSPHERKQQR